MQMKNERISEQWSKETTCTTRTNSSCVWREITDFTLLSFPEDCARLKLSSARASQAGLKEMITG